MRTEFNKWYNNIEKKYPLYQDKDGYNIGNVRALRVGFQGALEWVLNKMKDKTISYTHIHIEIEKALEVMRKEIS